MALVVLAFGIYALVDGAAFADLVNAASPDVSVNLYDTAVVLIIIVATFIMIVAFFGCCGAWKVNTYYNSDYLNPRILVTVVSLVSGLLVGNTLYRYVDKEALVIFRKD